MTDDSNRTPTHRESVASSLNEALLDALADRDRNRRETTSGVAARTADPGALIDLIADHVAAAAGNAALEALVEGRSRSVPSLLRALRHRDPKVVMFAASLRAIGNVLEHQPDVTVLRSVRQRTAISCPKEASARFERSRSFATRRTMWRQTSGGLWDRVPGCEPLLLSA